MCATEDERVYLKVELLGNKKFSTRRLYSGSVDGWNPKDFHRNCDEEGTTVSLFKVKDGPCIGGYTELGWKSKKYITGGKDEAAFIFNLTDRKVFRN
jgi:hypothetical protein